jgi:hypothetical protein
MVAWRLHDPSNREASVKRLPAMLRNGRAHFASWASLHFFRFWTAAAVIVLFGLGFWYAPEILTWWQRTVMRMINDGSGLLPYPWSDRVQFIMINLGASIWLQITAAIVLFRVLLWPIALWIRRGRAERRKPGDA